MEPTDTVHFPRWLRVGGEGNHEEAEREGDQECDTRARHGSLLRARMCEGILRVLCHGRNSHVADEIGVLSSCGEVCSLPIAGVYYS
jgi:hypothetical protein